MSICPGGYRPACLSINTPYSRHSDNFASTSGACTLVVPRGSGQQAEGFATHWPTPTIATGPDLPCTETEAIGSKSDRTTYLSSMKKYIPAWSALSGSNTGKPSEESGTAQSRWLDWRCRPVARLVKADGASMKARAEWHDTGSVDDKMGADSTTQQARSRTYTYERSSRKQGDDNESSWQGTFQEHHAKQSTSGLPWTVYVNGAIATAALIKYRHLFPFRDMAQTVISTAEDGISRCITAGFEAGKRATELGAKAGKDMNHAGRNMMRYQFGVDTVIHNAAEMYQSAKEKGTEWVTALGRADETLSNAWKYGCRI